MPGSSQVSVLSEPYRKKTLELKSSSFASPTTVFLLFYVCLIHLRPKVLSLKGCLSSSLQLGFPGIWQWRSPSLSGNDIQTFLQIAHFQI